MGGVLEHDALALRRRHLPPRGERGGGSVNGLLHLSGGGAGGAGDELVRSWVVDVHPFGGFAFDEFAVDDVFDGGDGGEEARELGAGDAGGGSEHGKREVCLGEGDGG